MGKIPDKYDCLRGCQTSYDSEGGMNYKYNIRCCKRASYDWLRNMPADDMAKLFEVRFKNTRKGIFQNISDEVIREGDFVVTEAQNGCDLGIVTLAGAIVANQLKRNNIDPANYEFRKIYRKARQLDLEKWQDAISREYTTMIRSREMAAELSLNMKIGDVEFQGDGSKAIFYYIADERVDFRQLIKNFAEEFHIRIEMKQIGARQEAGLIGGMGVCGQPLCCSRYMRDFQSITTSAARCQDLSLNPQKLAGQCGKLKCCINYEAAVYIDAKEKMPKFSGPLHLEDGDVFPVKSDALQGTIWFSYRDKESEVYPLNSEKITEILKLNAEGKKGASLSPKEKIIDFKSAAGEDSITRFDSARGKKRKGYGPRGNGRRLQNRPNRSQNSSQPAPQNKPRNETKEV